MGKDNIHFMLAHFDNNECREGSTWLVRNRLLEMGILRAGLTIPNWPGKNFK